MSGGAWPAVGSTAAAAAAAAGIAFGGRRRRIGVTAAAATVAAAGLVLAGLLPSVLSSLLPSLRHDAGAAAGAPRKPVESPASAIATPPPMVGAAAADLPVVADDGAARASAAAVAVGVAVAVAQPAPSPGRLSIRSLADGRLDVDALAADRLQAVAALADATGTRLYGAESLPRSFGRVTVRLAGVDPRTAWQRLLDGAAVGFALACDRRSCAVWFAPAVAAAADVAAPATAAPGSVLHPRVESTEGEN